MKRPGLVLLIVLLAIFIAGRSPLRSRDGAPDRLSRSRLLIGFLCPQ